MVGESSRNKASSSGLGRSNESGKSHESHMAIVYSDRSANKEWLQTANAPAVMARSSISLSRYFWVGVTDVHVGFGTFFTYARSVLNIYVRYELRSARPGAWGMNSCRIAPAITYSDVKSTSASVRSLVFGLPLFPSMQEHEAKRSIIPHHRPDCIIDPFHQINIRLRRKIYCRIDCTVGYAPSQLGYSRFAFRSSLLDGQKTREGENDERPSHTKTPKLSFLLQGTKVPLVLSQASSQTSKSSTTTAR